jgi:hypothetical protein
VLSILIYFLVREASFHENVSAALNQQVIPLILVVYTFLMGMIALLIYMLGWSLFGLTCYHSYLIGVHTTTNEYIKRKFSNDGNPYDQGCLRNYYTTLFQRRDDSQLDFKTWEALPSPV